MLHAFKQRFKKVEQGRTPCPIVMTLDDTLPQVVVALDGVIPCAAKSDAI